MRVIHLDGKELEREYRWWLEDAIREAVEKSATEHAPSPERWVPVPDEGFHQLIDEHGNVFAVTITVEKQ